MKIDIDKELEEAHKAYKEEKKGILIDLAALSNAMLDMSIIEEVMTPEHFLNFNKIISRAMHFIAEKEI